MKNPYLSVIIPAFNEEANFDRGTLQTVFDYLSAQKYSWEVIVVNDGSTDKTTELVTDFVSKHKNFTLINNKHQGKAQTVITGALAARGEIVLFSDMDQATPITETEKLLESLKSADIVIGSRSGRKGAPAFRQVLAYGMVILRAIILRLPFKDTQCGFKALKQPAAKKIFTIMSSLRPEKEITGPSVDPGFDVELLFLGRKLNLKISEIPVEWSYQETRRVRFVYDAISGLQGLLVVRWRSLINAYGLK